MLASAMVAEKMFYVRKDVQIDFPRKITKGFFVGYVVRKGDVIY